VLDAKADKQSILEKTDEASSRHFKSSLEGMTNPYGDGHAAERIVEILTSVPLGTDLLRKRASSPE
jgi:UDP-N-acetylglucosamine 2-epimerase (non-hydrolysing)/GDP/UDP-N,N'-diacetylbacillosamine 2-epimerase (hydrolysing)